VEGAVNGNVIITKMNFPGCKTAELTLSRGKTSKKCRNKEKRIAKSFISY
jgi:hypothetical protein